MNALALNGLSDSTPTVGTPFTATISGFDANTVVTLTVECPNVGVKTLTDTANASGVASFSVTLTAAGTCTLTATNVAGAVLATQTVLGVMGFGLWGGLFVLVGAGALIAVKRRRPAQVRA